MGITINQRMDTSYLFSSMSKSTGAGSDLSNILSDYASIKNGSYGKLMKAYYGSNANSSVKSMASSSTAARDDSKTIASIQSKAGDLKSAAEDLLKTGSDSLFTQKDIEKTAEDGTKTTEKGYDTDGIYKAVSKFVDSYNAAIKSASDSNNQSIVNAARNMVNETAANAKLLSKVGISMGLDGKLSVDEAAFKKADMKTVENLFGSKGSYAYGVQARASYMEIYAKSDAAKASGLYSQNGTYNATAVSSGNNFLGTI